MIVQSVPYLARLILAVSMIAGPAGAAFLKDGIAPTGKLRVAIGISPSGGVFWLTKKDSGAYAGVPVDLGTGDIALLNYAYVLE
jgi:polar amino acid transport system substrate-binding protein